MAELSVIPKMPKRFSDVDTEIWAAEALCMLQNSDWKTRPHYLVGLDEEKMWFNTTAFHFVMGHHGVPMALHKRTAARQAINHQGIAGMDNVFVFGGYRPDTFFDLMEGSFAIPMGDSIDAISDAYDAGEPIWIIQLKFRG